MVLRRRDKEERKASPLSRMRSTIKPSMQSVIPSEFSFESDSEMMLSERLLQESDFEESKETS
jgi:hypothetical protein